MWMRCGRMYGCEVGGRAVCNADQDEQCQPGIGSFQALRPCSALRLSGGGAGLSRKTARRGTDEAPGLRLASPTADQPSNVTRPANMPEGFIHATFIYHAISPLTSR